MVESAGSKMALYYGTAACEPRTGNAMIRTLEDDDGRIHAVYLVSKRKM